MEDVVTIELFGQPYAFKTESDAVGAQEAADHLVQEVARIQEQLAAKHAEVNKMTVLLIAALSIAHENRKLKSEHSNWEKELSSRSRSLVGRLDAYLNC